MAIDINRDVNRRKCMYMDVYGRKSRPLNDEEGVHEKTPKFKPKA